jgi:choice-of-anchor B domain-containing protein
LRILYTLLLQVCFVISLFSQQPQNVELLSNFNPYPSVKYNDCWGYVDAQGREYALLGVRNGTSIVEITNPAAPVERAFIPGPSSTWRDIKTHSTYAYVTTEGTGTGTGLQIINLANLPQSATLVKSVTTWFTSAHNLYIDNGFCYVVGTGGGGGMHILSLADPINPVRTAYYTASGYIHDVYVWNDTAYVSSDNTWDLVNVSNKSNPVKLSVSPTFSGIYAHSGWLTEDKRYFIACEEFNVRDIVVFDLQDRSTWDPIVPQWQMPGNSPVHNVFVKGNYAHIAYYKDGYVVLDISNPANPVKVGHYDTYPGTAGTYEGAWGAYPYFPSGRVIVSDISTGLYVFKFLLDDGSVPVELTSFSYSIENNSVMLKWTTATELNNHGFSVERSGDNQNWYKIGFIEGRGTTTESSEYSFLDNTAARGVNYYRLVQRDFDGTETILNSIEVNLDLPVSFSLLQNYPNPFNPSTKISYRLNSDSEVKLAIFDILGEEVALLVNEKQSSGSYEYNFNASALPSGIYLAQLFSGSSKATIKMLLMK